MTDRHTIRARWHDYNEGVYFVTICSHMKKHTFGQINEGQMCRSLLGELVESCLLSIPAHHKDCEVLNYIVMPNHVHLVVSVGTRYIASASSPKHIGCLKPPAHGEECNDYHHNSALARIIGSFKAAVTREARMRYIASLPIWQSGFHEHIICTAQSYDNIMNYIDNNVINWHSDCFNRQMP